MFALIAVITRPTEIVTGPLILVLVGVTIVVTVVGALLGRLLRGDPERSPRGTY